MAEQAVIDNLAYCASLNDDPRYHSRGDTVPNREITWLFGPIATGTRGEGRSLQRLKCHILPSLVVLVQAKASGRAWVGQITGLGTPGGEDCVCYICRGHEGTAVRKLRISVVEFLNTAPLVWGFTEGPQAGKYDLSFTVPSRCADALKGGNADVAIIPAIEYQRIDDVVALPGMAVAADGEVRSLLVVSKKPIQRVKRIALDTSSRATVALVKMLAPGYWNISPEFVEAAPNPSEMLQDADAALIIGDPALRIAIKLDSLSGNVPSGEQCCQGDPDEMPVPGFETLFVYDVAHQWRQMTGKPCVLAIWAGRKDAITPEVVADFQASKEYGMQRVREIAEGASIKLDLPVRELERYLIENVRFNLDSENLAGLELYFEKAAALGLIARNKPLEFAEAPAQPSLQQRA
jgi:chorismate dehydratase